MRKPQINRMKEKQAQVRSAIFPKIDEKRVWDIKNKSRTKGFTSIPRTMPLIGSIMDDLAGKGKPVSTTFLELWCRSNEQGFLTLSKPQDTAFASGFVSERGVSTWRERIRLLSALGFISVQPGPSGDLSYVQIWNPYLVIKEHHEGGTEGFPTAKYNALVERVAEIGAIDLQAVAGTAA